MARSARRYDLFLLLTDNDGRPFADELFDAVERRLLARFGGLTSQQRDFPLRASGREKAASTSMSSLS
jgi:hypothetical protein